MDPVTLALAKSWAEGEFGDLRELGPHIEAILDSRIVEMGSNANGQYVRWENGLQMCFHTGPTVSLDASSYVVYDWNQFPASFDEIWLALGAASTVGGAAASRQTRGVFGVSGDVYRLWMVNDSSQGRSMTPHFLAVGRYK